MRRLPRVYRDRAHYPASIGAPALHERIAVVLQAPLHWPMTAADNLRIGRLDQPDAGDVAFPDAAARSGADAVLAALPDGAETMLSGLMARGGTYHELFSLQARAYADT